MIGARRVIDPTRISRLVSRPGVDPRQWLTYAVVKELGFDPAEGMFADVQYVPTGEIETVLVGASYAGNDFGCWAPLEVDDTVVVGIPGGDPGNGPVILARVWKAGDKPNADMGNGEVPTRDFVLRVNKNSKLRIRTSGEGDIEIVPEGSGKVYLGDVADTEPAVRGLTLQNWLNSLQNQINAHVAAFNAHVHTVGAPGPSSTPFPIPGSIPETPITAPPDVQAQKVVVR